MSGWPAFIIHTVVWAGVISGAAAGEPAWESLERSYWLHASLADPAQKGYWGAAFPDSIPATPEEIRLAAKLLGQTYRANRLYLIYHREIAVEQAERVFADWQQACGKELELVPTLLLRMYDAQQSQVFTAAELQRLMSFFQQTIHAKRLAVYDVYPGRDQGASLAILGAAFAGELIRVGIQPEENVPAPFVAAVQDTWSGFCHGKTNADWRDRGFGADALARWVERRNRGPARIAWDLIAVAWDYSSTRRGEYPGYDDAARNMPLPAGRNALAVELILRNARPENLAGFSSDLLILQANSRHPAHDGTASFYGTLKRGEPYRGYYSGPLEEIAKLFAGRQPVNTPVTGSLSPGGR